MSSAWSLFIIVVSLANILACWWLIRWTAKPRPGEAASTDTTGHVWDGDLTEYNKPMPRWWLWLFHITIVFGLIYLVLYPGLGAFQGLLGWSQYTAYEDQVAAVEERVAPLFDRYAETAIPELSKDDQAMATGGRLFANNCAVCHGSDGRGAPGFPNLADNAWQYGGTPEAIYTSILNGRNGVMPAFGDSLGTRGLEELSGYVFHLAGGDVPENLIRAGEKRYQQLCMACHGADAGGNTQIGAPSLTDNSWLYGGSLSAIRTSIAQGRQGRMPAQKDLLGEERSHVLAAYVYSLGGAEEPDDD